MTFQVICPANKPEGDAYVWTATPDGAILKGIPCAAIAAHENKLQDDIPRLEKQFGKLSSDPHERAIALYDIAAFRNLIESVRHGDSLGWERYIDAVISPRVQGVKYKQAKGGSWLEAFTTADRDRIKDRESKWKKELGKGFNLSTMLWDNDVEMGLKFVAWNGRSGTRPAIYAPNLKMAVMAFCLAQMESPGASWALCPVCGKEFERKRKNEIYCTPKCYSTGIQRKHRERNKKKATDKAKTTKRKSA